MPNLLSIDRRDSVAVLTLDNPEKRNALTAAMVEELSDALARLQLGSEYRAIVLTGASDFSAGGDLAGMAGGLLQTRRTIHAGHRIVRQLIGGLLPVVAAVEGRAYGAGFSLAMACDFVVADENSIFCAAFGKVGLAPDSGLIWTLPQRVGIGLAREIMMLCQPIPGKQAHGLGLVDRYCPPGQVLDTAIELARRLADASPAAVQTTKSMLARFPLNFDAVLACEIDAQSLLLRSSDFDEGVSAFREKRTPDFSEE